MIEMSWHRLSRTEKGAVNIVVERNFLVEDDVVVKRNLVVEDDIVVEDYVEVGE